MKYPKLIAAMFFTISLIYADVIIEQVTKTTGMMGMGSAEAHAKSLIKSDRQRTEVTTKITGMGATTNQTMINIIRLDKKVMWNIFSESKAYSEMSFAQIKKLTEGIKTKVEEDKTQTKPSITVKKTGEKKTINGYECEHVIVTMKTKINDMQTGSPTEGSLNNDMWLASLPKVEKEVNDFNKKLTEMLGAEETGQQIMQGMMGISKKDYKEFEKQIKAIKGFPIVSEISIKTGKEGNVLFSVKNEIKSISTKDVASSQFELPQGYKIQEIPALN